MSIMTRSLLPPVACKPWCTEKDGHTYACSPEDQACFSENLTVEMSQEPAVDLLDGHKRPDSFGATLIHYPGEDDSIELTHDEGHAGYLSLPEARELVQLLQLLIDKAEGGAR